MYFRSLGTKYRPASPRLTARTVLFTICLGLIPKHSQFIFTRIQDWIRTQGHRPRENMKTDSLAMYVGRRSDLKKSGKFKIVGQKSGNFIHRCQKLQDARSAPQGRKNTRNDACCRIQSSKSASVALLNLFYKINTKMLTQCLSKILPQCVFHEIAGL